MEECAECARILTGDEIGLTKKLINRGTERFFCKTCLAKKFRVSEELLSRKIQEFRAMGCVLFP